MSTQKTTSIVCRDTIRLQELIDSGNRKKFIEAFNDCHVRLHNSALGDTFLMQAAEQVYRNAIEKFILA